MYLVKLSQVNVFLPTGAKPLLRNLNIEINPGEWISLVGKNGCGKSMLGKLLAGLDIPYDGKIIRSEEGSFCQLVMQNPDSQLVGETVWEDICFGLEVHGIPADKIKEMGALALKSVGLSGLEDRLVHSLSGGQKQLLAIGGGIALQPSIIIADEVTSMLDPASRKEVLGILKKLNTEGVTIIMITQLLEELVYSGRIVAIDNGAIVYDGGKEDFFYKGILGDDSLCEDIGLEPPYTVKVAKRMQKQGIRLEGYPILPEELLKAVVVK